MTSDRGTKHRETIETAEQRLLASEGVEGRPRMVDLKRLGGQLRVVEAGEGPPVLMVPGTMTAGAVLAGLVGRMPDYRCIMVDRPGVGLSPMIDPPPTSMTEHERLGDALLVDVVDGLGIARSHVVCTSLGGYAAMRSVAAHPERFDRMVGLAFQVGAPLEKLPLSMRVPKLPALIPKRVPVGPKVVKAMLKSAGMRGVINKGLMSEELLAWMATIFRYSDTFGNESRYSPDLSPHSPELLARVDVPVHLFWGVDDYFAGEKTARGMAAALPNATLQMVEDAGHAPWLDKPDLAAEAVRAHLSAS